MGEKVKGGPEDEGGRAGSGIQAVRRLGQRVEVSMLLFLNKDNEEREMREARSLS